MRSFLERLLFPYFTYTDPPQSLFPKKIPTAFIYTMNVPEEMMREWDYERVFGQLQWLLQMVFGASEFLYSCDTLQFKDYARWWRTGLIRRRRPEGGRKSFPRSVSRPWPWEPDWPGLRDR